MTQYAYLHFICDATELQEKLSFHGAEGWRLHTCEPIRTTGPAGSGLLQAFVVMDGVVLPPEPTEEPEPEVKGMAMRG